MKKAWLLLFIPVLSCNNNAEQLGIYSEVKGSGRPTVIFESGMAGTFDEWDRYTDSLSTLATTFAYDRSGIGKSDSAQLPRTIPNMVYELRTELINQGLEPPYILVGHSMGSYISRYFAFQYPNEVKAMILIDPSPNRLYDEYSEEEMADFISYGDDALSDSPQGDIDEWEAYLDNRKYMRGMHTPEKFPVTIYSGTDWDFWEYHEDLMNTHPESRHIELEGSHALHKERFEKIFSQIVEYIELAKTH